MKTLKEFILEGKKHIDNATVADFYQWAVIGDAPSGDYDQKFIDYKDCVNLLDNGWFAVFDTDGDQEESCKKIAEFFKKNWDKNIKVVSKETSNNWEVSFKLDGKTYGATFMTYFGNSFSD
jgi:hypothetical protein